VDATVQGRCRVLAMQFPKHLGAWVKGVDAGAEGDSTKRCEFRANVKARLD